MLHYLAVMMIALLAALTDRGIDSAESAWLSLAPLLVAGVLALGCPLAGLRRRQRR